MADSLGSEGYNKAAEFAAENLKKIGLLPAGEEGYFQYLDVEYNRIDTPVVFNISSAKKNISYEHGKDFVLRGFTAPGNLLIYCLCVLWIWNFQNRLLI
ncbi:MAG: hypothetical protein U5J96_15100 [Ignavibacteriaceae bacterium]|nr:hypothetical protein [Ignavibacteriaceae bacterium]